MHYKINKLKQCVSSRWHCLDFIASKCGMIDDDKLARIWKVVVVA
jgi:hypothetical protein